MDSNTRYEVVRITSNTDKLSAKVIHDVLINLVRNEAIVGETALKALVPKREGDMAEKAGHTGPVDEGEEIKSSVGIPEIHKVGESDPLSAKYPLFSDQGTGIFGEHGTIFPTKKQFMYIPPQRGIPGFLRSSKGQEGKEFLAASYAVMVAMLQINGNIFKAELTTRLQAE